MLLEYGVTARKPGVGLPGTMGSLERQMRMRLYRRPIRVVLRRRQIERMARTEEGGVGEGRGA